MSTVAPRELFAVSAAGFACVSTMVGALASSGPARSTSLFGTSRGSARTSTPLWNQSKSKASFFSMLSGVCSTE